ncbi:MAG: hypothetical protein PHC90_01950 [Syntrophorhabdaceae bacterium]|nr:hypothetical protein [Syntrophorhabdaceae bacterium]
MKITFTKQQFETLLKAVYLGTRMVNIYEDEPQDNEYFDLQRYVFGSAKDFGLQEYADYDEEEKGAAPSEAFEEDESLNELIERYDDFTFLDKLIYNLAGRDMLNKHGQKGVEKMSDDEFFKEEESLVLKYQNEFAKNGIRNLIVSKGK